MFNEDIWEQKFSEFKKDVEEESILFPEVKKVLGKDELERIGKEMYEFKKKIKLPNGH